MKGGGGAAHGIMAESAARAAYATAVTPFDYCAAVYPFVHWAHRLDEGQKTPSHICHCVAAQGCSGSRESGAAWLTRSGSDGLMWGVLHWSAAWQGTGAVGGPGGYSDKAVLQCAGGLPPLEPEPKE
ncbi:hypothetical protein NDU88_003883 [Pleurodeles waltl]|uniref:Uncharacterized protein n=1 Tax=Pleurodeles waltl TaxID=8319 RepID=A0AAV7TQB2_PLEWA|nr:hypothetical protein NDU88_003883 [Pleurodeles waltl]